MPYQNKNKNNGGNGGKGNPGPPSIKNYLAQDKSFQNTKLALDRAMTRYNTQSTRATDWTNADYSNSVTDMRHQAHQDRVSMADDAASRGIFTSGVYGKEQQDYNTALARQKDAQQRARNRALIGISSNLGDQRLVNNQQIRSARQDAILRYYQQFGLTGAPGNLGG